MNNAFYILYFNSQNYPSKFASKHPLCYEMNRGSIRLINSLRLIWQVNAVRNENFHLLLLKHVSFSIFSYFSKKTIVLEK